jgi:hypothetical protein
MTTQQLGSILRSMYNLENANKKTMILLFGVKYASEIREAASTSSISSVVNEIVTYAGVPSSYATEIKAAIDLSKYVEVKSTTSI